MNPGVSDPPGSYTWTAMALSAMLSMEELRARTLRT